MSAGQTCGYMGVQGVPYSVVPSGSILDAYILVWVHLLRCSIVFEPLFHQTFHNLFSSDLVFL